MQKYADLANAAKGGGFSIESLGKTLTNFVQSPVSAAKEGIAGFAEKLGPAAVGLMGIASAAIAAGAAIFKLAESAAEEAEQITNLSLRTGIGVERVQSLQKAAELMGVSGEIGRLGGLEDQPRARQVRDRRRVHQGNHVSRHLAGGRIREKRSPPSTCSESFGRSSLISRTPPSAPRSPAAVLGRRNQELAPLLMNAKENLFDLAKQLEDTGAVMDKVAIDQAMKLDEKLDVLSARFAKVKTIAKEAAVETALAVSDLFTGRFLEAPGLEPRQPAPVCRAPSSPRFK